MPLFTRRSRSTPAQSGPPPRDVETLEQLLGVLHEGVVDAADAHRKVAATIVEPLWLAYVGAWFLDEDGQPHLVSETDGRNGPMSPALTSAGRELPALWRRAVAQRTPLRLDAETPRGTAPRWDAAARAGATEGALVPVSDDTRVVAVYECYSAAPLPFFGPRAAKWSTILRIAANACADAAANARASAAVRESVDDRDAISAIVARLAEARDETAALDIALSTVQNSFGWTWAGCWRGGDGPDPLSELRLVTQSRSSATRPAGTQPARTDPSSGPGSGGDSLVRRAWRERDLVTGLASDGCGGLAFPLMGPDGVRGVLELSNQAPVVLSESRRSALRNVQLLVSQRLDVLRRTAVDVTSARELLDTVTRLRESTQDATRVAEGAVTQASAMKAEVEALSSESSAISDVIAIISGIAQQTNLRSLNATIEAARAGEVGLGFAVVAGEVKDLARATAAATTRVAEQIAGIQASSRAVTDGIHATSSIVGEMDAVQARISAVLEEQTEMAQAFDRRA